MALAALIIACVALVLSLISTFWALRKAKADRVIAQSAIDRRHDETTPRISVTLADRTHVAIVNQGPQDLDEIRFDIVDGDLLGLLVEDETTHSASLGALPIGHARTIEAIEAEDGRGGTARLRFTCKAKTERWIVGGYFEVEPLETGNDTSERAAPTAGRRGSGKRPTAPSSNRSTAEKPAPLPQRRGPLLEPTT